MRDAIVTPNAHLERWVQKIQVRTRDRKSISKWAVHLLRRLQAQRRVAGGNSKTLAQASGVPLKFLPRTLAVLDRYGLVIIRRNGAALELCARLPKTLKPRRLSRPSRVRIATSVRRRIHKADGGRCAMTGRKVALREAVLDHIIPFAFGGVDHAANLVTTSRPENTRKWDGFAVQIHWYRGERVRGKVGMRWRGGAFWPVINGRLRRGS